MRSLSLTGLVALAASLGNVLGAPSAGCGKTATYQTGTTNTLTVNGKERQYIVRLPENYDNNKPYRLIFTIHALGGNAQQLATGAQAYYGLPPLVNGTAIFISPNGQTAGSAFNAMGWGNTGGEDIQFINAIREAVESNLCVDQNLRFSVGFSYGAAMSYSIACTLAKDFRAVGILSGNVLSGCSGGRDPIAFYQQHGTRDQVLGIAGARQMRDNLLRNNGCTAVSPEPTPATGARKETVYTGCDPKYPAKWVVFDGDHTPYPTEQGQTGSFSAGNVWQFFSQFT